RLDAIWKSRGDKFDMIYDSTSITVKQILQEALAAGFSELTIKRGVISAARDEPRTLYGHMYTPQNMTQALKIGKSAPSEDDYDGVDVEFTNSNGWIEDTIQCRLPEDVGRKVEKIKAAGITDRNRAYRYGMRRRMVQKYRRTNYTFSTELDALNSEYWDYVALADDVPGFGQSSLLLSAINTGSNWLLKSSEPFDWSAPGPYVVAIRRPDGTLSGPYSASRFDEYHLVVPALDFTPDTSWDIEPPHLLFGTSTRFAYPALISSIDPDGFSGASVQAVNYDSRVYTYDNASAPS
ncbi:host specificity factor TipJ family phage tail protein, partial [Pseudomonas aeruginosa]